MKKQSDKKICRLCFIEKTLPEFPTNGLYKGRVRYSSRCKVCDNKKSKLWYLKNRELYNERNRARKREYQRRPEEKFKASVRLKTRIALKNGLLQKKPCEVCNEPKTYAHHPDYNYPLKVQWLCSVHHYQIHHKNHEVITQR